MGAEWSDPEVARLLALRQYHRGSHRAPHKPLLALLALGRLAATGRSTLAWSEIATRLSGLIAEFGPPSRTTPRQAAAYPFTHLRSDGVWELSADVPMDLLRPLDESAVTGSLPASLEQKLLADPGLLDAVARSIVEAQFPATVAPDVLAAVGFEPELLAGPAVVAATGAAQRRRSPTWRAEIMQAWDRRCAFCGYDGSMGGAPVGIDAAHVRWFNFGGPDEPDNGLALCALDHKLFDRGVLGLSADLRVLVSQSFTASSEAGRRVYALHRRALAPRPGTASPALDHISWHRDEVFKGRALAA